MKLTALQAETLEAVARLPSTVRQMNCGYGAWRIIGASPNAVGKLTSLGLIRVGVNNWYELTDAGRGALAEIEQP
jgi:hypothetical protein